jgi:hypothetical protein
VSVIIFPSVTQAQLHYMYLSISISLAKYEYLLSLPESLVQLLCLYLSHGGSLLRLLSHCCFCTAARMISTLPAEFAADPVCRAVSGAIGEDEELANDLARCAAVCKDFKVSKLVFSRLTECTERLLCSQSRQQRAAQNALDDSLDPKEREAWKIASLVTWGNLLPESGGIEISDTALRAISLEQLHQIIMHVTSRIEGGEQWTVARYPHGEYAEHQITKVDEVITETTHMMMAELVSQVNLYDADKYLIRPATVDSRRSFVEACCLCLAWAFLSRLWMQIMAAALQSPDFFCSHWCVHCCSPLPSCKTIW